jgi:hypothetical protein
MKNLGKSGIGIVGLLFIIAIVLLVIGKIGFMDFILFPFYILGGCFGIFLGGVICVAVLVGIIWLLMSIFG